MILEVLFREAPGMYHRPGTSKEGFAVTDITSNRGQLFRILFGDSMVPYIDSILLLGYSILYKEYYLTRFNHQKKHYSTEAS